MPAALSNTSYDLRCRLGVEFRTGVVVEKEQGFCAGNEHVVDAHGYKINAQSLDASAVDAKLEFGADAVSAADQDWFLVLAGQAYQCAKATDTAEHLWPMGALDDLANVADKRVTRVNINTGISIGKGLF